MLNITNRGDTVRTIPSIRRMVLQVGRLGSSKEEEHEKFNESTSSCQTIHNTYQSIG